MRQSLTGDGPGAGIPERGKAVVIWGLPSAIQSAGVERILEDIEGLPPLSSPVAVVPPRDGPKLVLTSRALVRLRNTDEAHRLVRMVHQTTLSSGPDRKEYQLRAKVIY